MQTETRPHFPPPADGRRRRESVRFDDSPIPLSVAPRPKLRLSPREAGDIIGCSEDQVRKDVRAGAMPGHQVGGRTVIYRQELEEWQRGGALQARAERARVHVDRLIEAADQLASELRALKEKGGW